MTFLVEPNESLAERLIASIGPTQLVGSLADLQQRLPGSDDDLVVLGPNVDQDEACGFAATQRMTCPARGIVLVRNRVNTAVLTSALRAGVREVVPVKQPAALSNACRSSLEVSRQVRAARQPHTAGAAVPQPHDDRGEVGRVLTVASSKGGVGKTTVATNMAVVLARLGHRVCLVDLDLAFGDVAIALKLFPNHSMMDAVASGDLDQTAVRGLVTAYDERLDALLAPVEPSTVDNIPPEVVTRVVTVLREMYDFVVIDTPPAFTEHTLTAFDSTDELLLVASLDVPALKNLRLMMQTLDLLNFPAERRTVVLNRADADVGLSVADAVTVLEATIALEIPSSRAVPASINKGVPLAAGDPRHAVSVAFSSFVKRRYPMPLFAVAVPDHRRLTLRRRGARA